MAQGNPFGKHLSDDGGNPFGRAQPSSSNPLGAFASGAGDALTFGFGDEAQYLWGGQEAVDAARRRQMVAQTMNPLSFGAGQIGGAIGGGIATGGLGALATGGRALSMATRLGPVSRLALGAASGGAGGFAYGAGSSEGDLGERAEAGLKLAPWGAAFGLGGQGLAEVGGRVFQAARRAYSPEVRAAKMVADSITRFDGSEASIAAKAAELGPLGGTAMDVLPGGVQIVKGAGVRPSAGREKFRTMLDDRNNAFGGQTADDLWQAVEGAPRGSAADDVSALMKDQKDRAAPIYTEVYAGKVSSVPPQLAALVDRNPSLFGPAKARALESVRRLSGLQGEALERYAQTLPLYWHRLLGNTQAEVSAAFQAAKTNPLGAPRGSAIAEMTQDSQALNTMVRRLLGPRFREAQDIFSGDARMIDAIGRGYDAVTKTANDLDIGELTRWMARASKGELGAMRRAALTRLSDMLDNADTMTGRTDVLRAIRANKGQERVLRQLFGTSLDDVIRKVDGRRELFSNSVDAGIGVNSHTADKLAAAESQQMRTMPFQGGWREGLMRVITGDAADQFDEAVSNQVLGMMRQPARNLAQPGAGAWAKKSGLLARAMKEAESKRLQRTNALFNALGTGAYAAVGADAGMGYGGL